MAIWEFAPGSPWNAIFMILVLVMAPCISRSGFGQYLTSSLEVGRGIYAARHGIDDPDVDPHSRLQRPQLLQFLLLLERRRREADEALKRGAAVGVETDVMVARSLAVGRGRAGEIQRAQPPGADRRADRLHDVGVRGFFLGVDFRGQRR